MTPPTSLRDATAPNRGGFGIMGNFMGTAKGPTIRGAVTQSVTEGLVSKKFLVFPARSVTILPVST